jgi:gas vesicle structural protein
MADLPLRHAKQVSLCEALDRVLNKGAVIAGELTISVADVDLIWLGIQIMVSSIETARAADFEPRVAR